MTQDELVGIVFVWGNLVSWKNIEFLSLPDEHVATSNTVPGYGKLFFELVLKYQVAKACN